MSVALLDVNVLIALFDSGHVHSQSAHDWFREHSRHGWATCPLTQNGCLRILGHPRFTNARIPRDGAGMLATFCSHPKHEFWADSISIADDAFLALDHLQGVKQLTDVYLLALAVRRGGHLATFDRSIPWRAVRGAKASHLKVLGSAH
jgi:toxin-antitoxin system PIN domain toxin